MIAQAQFHWRGVWLRFDYQPDFIDQLKRTIPPRFRSYEPTSKTWTVTTAYAEQAVDLFLSWFPETEVIRPGRHAYEHRETPPAAPPPNDPYRVLHLLPSAPDELVNAAVRTLARMYHPDLKADNERLEATKEMTRINIAVESIRRQRTAGAA